LLGNTNGILGFCCGGGTVTNWPGGGFDPETNIVYAPAANGGGGGRSVVAPPAGFSDIRYVSGVGGRPFREVFGPGDCCAADSGRRSRDQLPGGAEPAPAPAPAAGAPAAPAAGGGGDGGGGLNVQGLSFVKPPYGLISAIDVNRGEIAWQTPHGDTPDAVRNHPALRGLNIPKTGQPGVAGVGLLVTKALVVMGDPQVTSPPGR